MNGTKVDTPTLLRNAEVAFREDIIDQYLDCGDVLDVGVVDSRRGVETTVSRLEQFSTSLHEHIRRRNPRVTGVDIDEEGVEILRRRGYDVLCRNIEDMELGRTFDLIVAGEIIEHLPNAGLAMSNLRRHLNPGGHLILSTCNPFYGRQHLKIWQSGDVQVHDEHTAWFDPHTISRLLGMSGYEMRRLVWLQKRRGLSAWKNWRAKLRPYFSPNFLVVASPEVVEVQELRVPGLVPNRLAPVLPAAF
jgi:SAM-dependent methyltransferase